MTFSLIMQHRWKHMRRLRASSVSRSASFPSSFSFPFSLSLFFFLLSCLLFFFLFFYSPPDWRSLNLASPLSLLTLTRAFNNRGYVFCEMYGEVAPRGFNVGKARQKERESERERGKGKRRKNDKEKKCIHR